MTESRYSDEVLPAARYGSYASGMARISEVQVGVRYVRDEAGDIHPLMPPIRTLTDIALQTKDGVILPELKETEAASAVPQVLTTTMRHQPNGLGQYKSQRHFVKVVDSYGNTNDAGYLARDADAWLMAHDAFDLFGNVKPARSLRIPNPEEYNFHDSSTRHDRQDPYTVNVGTSSDLSEALHMPTAGNATRLAKLCPKQDAPTNYGRVVQGPMTSGALAHGDHKRDRIAQGPLNVVELAVGYRGKVSVGHGKWITPAGKGGRPTTEAARQEVAAAQLADILEVTRDEAGQAAYGRLMNGAQNMRLRTTDGVVITVRRSGHSAISIDVKRAQKRVKGQKAPSARTSCSHESYVSSAIDRCLAKLD